MSIGRTIEASGAPTRRLAGGTESMTIYTAAMRTGDEVAVSIMALLPAGYHVEPHEPDHPSSLATVVDTDDIDDPCWVYPQPTLKDLGLGEPVHVLEGTLHFVVTGRLAADARIVSGTLTYQPTRNAVCGRQRTIEWEAPVDAANGYSVIGAMSV